MNSSFMYEKVYSSFYCTHFAVLILNSGTEKSMVYWQDMIIETKSTDTYKEICYKIIQAALPVC
jgi:hypothetical protein